MLELRRGEEKRFLYYSWARESSMEKKKNSVNLPRALIFFLHIVIPVFLLCLIDNIHCAWHHDKYSTLTEH